MNEHTMQAEHREPESRGTAAFVLGGLVGAGLALLFAPTTGRDTRKRLRELRQGARERVTGMAEDLRDRVEHAVEEGRSFLEDKKTAVEAAYEAGREAFHREQDRGRAHTSDSPEPKTASFGAQSDSVVR